MAPQLLSAQDADSQIRSCLDPQVPKSFFLYAGAGSGKTRSLVEALKHLRETRRERLRLRGQRIGVITYTNKACEEIKRRMEYDPLIDVRTIHSFVWSLIEGYNADIKVWIENNLRQELIELREKQASGRAGKASVDRARKIEAKTERLNSLPGIKKFTYNPNGENFERDSLNHAEVLQIGAHFLTAKATMQDILVNRFPILFIDESQDTNKHLIDAFFAVEEAHADIFVLGLFGDMMQRIYFDGKEKLGENLPPRWAQPEKKINYRCPKRIVRFINKVRSDIDHHAQEAKSDAAEGLIHLFVFPATADRSQAESNARAAMASKTGDSLWTSVEQGAVKTLILEHHMAAKRLGFWEMFEPLSESDRLKTGLMTGELPGLKFFSESILPLKRAYEAGDKFAVARIVRERSPLLDKRRLGGDPNQVQRISEAKLAVDRLMELWQEGRSPTFLKVLLRVKETGLFHIPESLSIIAARTPEERQLPDNEEEDFNPWDRFSQAPFSQIEPFVSYISGTAGFDTHQGVKGLEFERVMVIIDDAESRGNWFDYEKLFGAKAETATDVRNRSEGKPTGNERTRRLLYVTASRAEKSLALVFFAENPGLVGTCAVEKQWLTNDEVTIG